MDAVHHLSIDIETYSDVDIGKAGLYRYAQSPAFAILLFAYSLDGDEVKVVDLTQEQYLPQEVLRYLFDPCCIKHAYNAAFEWYCLSRHFRLDDNAGYPPEKWLPQWHCAMLHGLYCGYTAGLAATGKALGLPEDKQKLAAGKALIKYFCAPCAPTKSNGGRLRNLPHHDPEKWGLFKDYNGQDVVTEMEIERRLSSFPVPDAVQAQWVTDQIINLRGVAVDTELVDGALELDAAVRTQYVREAARLSGLDNPNSVAQLTKWLQDETGAEITDLRKTTVDDLLGKDLPSDAARRMLKIRQELGKTSNKKYNALAAAVCADGRVRGLLQFYGANRTGRWAGRIVQPQNLPRTYIDGALLPLARDLVKHREKDALQLVYGSVTDTLSQLIRTAFVAAPGHVLVDADFSAIEARMIAWLAGEEWVLDVFRTHGKIYEAAAAQMFGVPIERIEKGNPEYSYRQKGKVATLALGYQGGTGALVNMGALRMGIPEEDLPDIVDRWRTANPAIVQFWYSVDAAAREAVNTGRQIALWDGRLTFARECDPANDLDFLTIQLPNGRKLYYAHPHMGVNHFGRPSLCYWGMNQTTHKWEVVETYGGKLAENITQAAARDCLAETIDRLEAAGYPVVFHIHDEVVIDVEKDRAGLDAVEKIMSIVPSWAPGLPLAADGWVNEFFKKD
ncbi:DNA polymerase [Agathobaculum sp. NTUH-O15-33]|uniref:DNA polymerase n=1 Tax=Agathobaculum sp. NTUH-O15-33 TaxID=3079302 RepID=UPI0029589467|nr:DNA polymerase [Agathobaculum sp. NTUH-O15-33]WNX84385.1 DNA polymerase [Agathobaculum sp. NTUH-O15-33]